MTPSTGLYCDRRIGGVALRKAGELLSELKSTEDKRTMRPDPQATSIQS